MSNFQAPPQQHYPPSPQQPYAPAPVAAQPKQRNVLGLVAFIVAVVGFIFACMPGALIIGWVLLPVAFILGLVALFQRGKVKWAAVTAVIVSVVGTIVGVIVFFGVVANAVDDAFNENDTTVNSGSDAEPAELVDEGDEAAAEAEPMDKAEPAAEAGTRENPLPLGSVIEGDEWTVTINSVTLDATDAVVAENMFNEAPEEGNVYILVNYTVTYTGDDPDGEMPALGVGLEYVTAGGNTVDQLTTSAVAPDAIDTLSTLYSGASVTGNDAMAVPAETDGVLAVRAGMTADKVFVAIQ